MRTGTICWVTGVLVPLVGVAQGEVRTFAVEGRVTSIGDPLGTLNFTHLGAPVIFEFSFDSEAPDLNETSTLGIYEGISSRVTIGRVEVTSGIPGIEIQHPGDHFVVYSELIRPGFDGGGFRFLLGDSSSSTSLSNSLLPASVYPLYVFPFRDMGAAFFYPNPRESSPYRLQIIASVDAFYVVPDPASACLCSPASCS